MVVGPPAPRAQTIKQAKASYKARGRPSISEAEKRKLERAAELERRAWRIQEAEKRKAEAAKKRAEKEKREREESAKAPLGTQRRIDRFGYKSSQMHLGAFLRKPLGKIEEQKENENLDVVGVDREELDEFADEEVDDASLLDTLDGGVDMQTKCPSVVTVRNPPAFTTAHALLPLTNTETTKSIPPAAVIREESFEDFFDELGTGTQIARELEADEPTHALSPPSHVPISKASSGGLDIDDFNFTVEDLEELDSLPIQQAAKQEDRKLMPPPLLPVTKPVPLPPSLPANNRLPPPAPAATVDHGFTLSQLEQFVDEDLQLTQVAPD